MPKAGFEIDDGIYAIGSFVLKNSGVDNQNNTKVFPFFPCSEIKYHEKSIYSVSLRSLPAYSQSYVQCFIKPGFESIKLENALFSLFSSVLVGFTFFMISGKVTQSLFCSSLFNIIPWVHLMANLHPEGSAYLFGSSCFLFAFYYYLIKKSFLSYVNLLLSMIMFFLSWAPAFIVLPVSIIGFTILVSFYSKSDRLLMLRFFISSVLVLFFIYIGFHEEYGFKWNLGRAASLGCLPGLSPFDYQLIFEGLKNNWHIYLTDYFGYLSPEFLFLCGDGNLRHNSGFGGQVLLSLAVAFYFALYFFGTKKINIHYKILFLYLLITILPYSLCTEGYRTAFLHLPLHAMRQSAMIIPVVLIIMVGLVKIHEYNKNTLIFI